MHVPLSETEAIRLTLLEAIASHPCSRTFLELELKNTLPIAGVLPEHHIDHVLVDTALRELEQAGLAVCVGGRDDVDEHGRLRSRADQAWATTAAGAVEREQLRKRVGATDARP